MAKQAAKVVLESDAKTESARESVHLNLASELVDEQEIAKLAYEFWQARGCPDGSPEEDWFLAERELQSRSSDPS